MSRSEVPIVTGRSRKHIESLAHDVVHRYDLSLLSEPRPFPIADFLEFWFPSQYGIVLRFLDLPAPTEAVLTPGSENGSPPTLIMTPGVYEAMLDGDGRARFTAAHEIGHGVLHAKEITHEIAHRRVEGLYRRSDIRAFENPEWQANAFAAALLMPTAAVKVLVAMHGREELRIRGSGSASAQADRDTVWGCTASTTGLGSRGSAACL
jgi:hypothetical protein